MKRNTWPKVAQRRKRTRNVASKKLQAAKNGEKLEDEALIPSLCFSKIRSMGKR